MSGSVLVRAFTRGVSLPLSLKSTVHVFWGELKTVKITRDEKVNFRFFVKQLFSSKYPFGITLLNIITMGYFYDPYNFVFRMIRVWYTRPHPHAHTSTHTLGSSELSSGRDCPAYTSYWLWETCPPGEQAVETAVL